MKSRTSTRFILTFGLVDVAASSLGLNAHRAQEWMQETVRTLQEVNIFWGNTRETKLATLRCVRASENA